MSTQQLRTDHRNLTHRVSMAKGFTTGRLVRVCGVALVCACGTSSASTRPSPIPDALLSDIPADDKAALFTAKGAVDQATAAQQGALHDLDVINRDIMVSGSEREQARSETHKFEAEYQLATESRDLNRISKAMSELGTARAGAKAADVRPNFLIQKRKQVYAEISAANAEVNLARAREELEKAKLAEKNGKRPSEGFSVGLYEKAVVTAGDEARAAKATAGREAEATAGFEKGYLQFKNEFDRMSGPGASGDAPAPSCEPK